MKFGGLVRDFIYGFIEGATLSQTDELEHVPGLPAVNTAEFVSGVVDEEPAVRVVAQRTKISRPTVAIFEQVKINELPNIHPEL